MSEYTEVEQPFLHQLQTLGWDIIDQGQQIPSDPSQSLRANRAPVEVLGSCRQPNQ